jgi:formate hydrogenlyase transcriptional activator
VGRKRTPGILTLVGTTFFLNWGAARVGMNIGGRRDLVAFAGRQSMREGGNAEQRYRLLARLGRVINSSLDIRRVLQPAARALEKLMGCQYVSLLLLAEQEPAAYGYALDFSTKMRWIDLPQRPLTGSATAWVADHGRSRRALADDADLYPDERQLRDAGFAACTHYPLHCRRRCIGVLTLATRDARRAEHWEDELLAELCNLLATAVDNAAAYRQINDLRAQLEAENVYLREEIQSEHDFANLIGTGTAMQQLREAVRQVAPTESTVLISGETGTGKELVARAIHDLSPRRDQVLVKVNCAALSEGVIGSELFGHEAGAFTGADRRRLGRFELAHRGTLFLDEVSEIPGYTQVLLLRVLQERVIERVGGNQTVPVDVRILAATNRDLAAAVAEGKFRADLFYRLDVFPVAVPALRERTGDIPALVEHFIATANRQMNKPVHTVSRRTMERLTAYPWPGNVRELQNIVQRAMIVSTGTVLEVDPAWLESSFAVAGESHAPETFDDAQRRTIVAALARCGGKVYGPNGAARVLGLKPSTLYGKMRRLGIERGT